MDVRIRGDRLSYTHIHCDISRYQEDGGGEGGVEDLDNRYNYRSAVVRRSRPEPPAGGRGDLGVVK